MPYNSCSELKVGAVRYRDEAAPGGWEVANPGDPLFPAVNMAATERWCGHHWHKLFDLELEKQCYRS